ncbi:chain-length determining protein [Paraburkholderia antibiotica]|uniref:Chain-length determining protein n=1 Tax=Paraburkholderia antibiotica TaxID=2728839 RepID=A0A7Y0A0N0_9BURK|nr:chain-length determining protein [Paraburkholderia antibiotica]NML34333.1 chain-length determining protein [Paraburkholderia antibiotica]
MSDASVTNAGLANRVAGFYGKWKKELLSIRIFRLIVRLIVVFAILSVPYWLFFASDRYVSDAVVVLQRTDQVSGPSVGVPAGLASIAGVGNPNSSDQLLLSEYLLSADMLNKLDAAFDLRSHYSNWHRDPISRMWLRNAPFEWFYSYWLSRVDVSYDDYNGVLDIKVQAYDPKTARAIVDFMIREGEAHMNLIGHQLAQSQVDFLTKQVTYAHDRLLDSTKNLLDFQNRQGLVAPQATAESLNALIDKLEAQKTDVQTQLASLPATLNKDQPTIVMLRKNLSALEAQIVQKRAELASPSRKTLNYTVEEFQRLQMQVSFAQDLYKTALSALEQGRMNAARMLKMVSILQAPTTPSYPMEPTRFYNVLVTLLIALALIGVVKLLEGIILDHVD